MYNNFSFQKPQCMGSPGTQSEKGVVGLEVMVVVAVLMLALTIAIPLFLNKSTDDRENITLKKIIAIKEAIVGDSLVIENGSRSSFGFVGDLGVLPANLTELIEQAPGRPNYGLVNNVWFGWRGPYLPDTRDGNNNYVALLDAWGNPITYTDSNGNPVDSSNPDNIAWPIVLRNPGTNDIYNLQDPCFHIYEDEVRTYVYGTFTDRAGNPVAESMVTVYFPNGTTGLDHVDITTGTVYPGNGGYSSQGDVLSDPNKAKIPIGIRYVETLDLQLKKLAALNGGSQSQINFVSGQIIELPAEMFERTFRPTDNVPDNQFRDIYTAGGHQDIPNPIQVSGGGYLTISGAAVSWPDDTTIIGFGTNQWDDYRVEANILHGDGHKYQVFYRMSSLGYNPAEPNDDLKISGSGYGFEFDPQAIGGADYTDEASLDRVVLRIWKYRNGLPRSVLVEKEYDRTAFAAWFGYPILWRAHQVSITVQNVGGNIEHHVLINGRQVFDSDIIDTGMPSTGSAGILVHRHTNFRLYHLLVHQIPPQAALPFVWWSFEEGFYNGNNHVYGFGYLNDIQVLIGELINPLNINRQWNVFNIHGQAIFVDGSGGGYINFGDVFDFDPSGTFSISLWARMPSFNPANQYVILSKRRSGGNDRGWELILTGESGHGFGAEFALLQREGGGSPRSLRILNDLNGSGIQVNEWYHIMVVYDGSGYSGGTTIDPSALQIYVTPQSSNQVNTGPALFVVEQSLRANSNTDNNEDMRLGLDNDNSRGFNGFIDEIKMYYRALTIDEVDELFQKDK